MNWITILTYTYPHEAHLAKSVLEAEGIPVFIKDELTAQVYNFYSTAIGGVKLQVPESDFQSAYELLKAGDLIPEIKAEPKIEKVTKAKDSKNKSCPFCGSAEVSRKKQLNILSTIIFMILGALFPLFKSTYHCHDCKKEWKYN
ncbi:MAG: DUF2007 domain-containing protein [Bacteroidales bacterium]|nr:DUF2007 domain-containing protein [Bacteroidales bacterium]